MSKAGDYVETAADRATKANVELENAMTRLGETFQPLTDAANSMWNDIKIGALDLLNSAIKPLVEWLTKAGQLKAEVNRQGGNTKVDADIEKLKGSNYKPQAYQMMLSGYFRNENQARNNLLEAQKGGKGSIAIWQNQYDAAKSMREMFQTAAQKILNPVSDTKPLPVEIKNPTGAGGASGNAFDASKIAFTGGEGFKADPNANFLSVWGMMGGDEGLRKMMGIGQKQFDLGRDITEKDYKKLPGYKDDKETKKLTEKISTLTSGLSSIASGLKSMGIDLPKEVDQVIGVIQGVTSVIEGVNSIISIFSTSAMAANTAAIVANTAALIANSTTNLIPLAGGGIVPHAAGGYLIGGNNYSGDNIFAGHAWVNSGELVLNRAQQGNLASQLQGGVGAMQLSAIITGEQLRLVLNNNGRRTGRGEYVTTNFR
jgi:hypothetical protein